MTVEVDVFSGRPNPHWSLAALHAQEVRRLLNNLPPMAGPKDAPSPPALGYRGIRLFDDNGLELARLYGGIAATGGRSAADPGRQLEAHLLQSGRGELDDGLLSQLLAGIEHAAQE